MSGACQIDLALTPAYVYMITLLHLYWELYATWMEAEYLLQQYQVAPNIEWVDRWGSRSVDGFVLLGRSVDTF